MDYKRGIVPDVPEQAYDPERVQLCLQGLVLRDNGYECASGVLYFAESRTRVEVQFDETLVALTESAVAGIKEMAKSGQMPPPLVDSPRCIRCSLNTICLPDEVRAWSGEPVAEPRRLVPSRSDALPLYVQSQGDVIGRSGDCLKVSARDAAPVEVRILDVSALAIYGQVQITSQALRLLQENGVPVALHSSSGWLSGTMDAGVGHKNVAVRIAQYSVVAQPEESLRIARRIVEGKISNQRTLLRRNLEQRDVALLGTMAMYARRTRQASSLESLMGIEGIAARTYFEALPRLLRNNGEWASRIFATSGRNRRPPKDEVNATLSFLYSLLLREAVTAVALVGFDPYCGFLHRAHFGRTSLALDIMEEFRPLVGDSVAIRLFNEGAIGRSDFVRRARGVVLTPAGRRRVIQAYERRINQTITHPMFGYTVSYRRTVELQVRLLRAVVMGEAREYRAFMSR